MAVNDKLGKRMKHNYEEGITSTCEDKLECLADEIIKEMKDRLFEI